MNTNTSKKTFLLVEGALMIAMAFVLSYIKLYDMPMGGSITLEMIPLVIMGLRHGVKWGTFTAAVHGIIQLILGFSNVMYCATIPAMIGCVLLDYLFAFTVLGLAGLFLPLFKNKLIGAAVGTAICGALRFLCSFLSGWLLGVDELHFYDLYTPVVPDADMKITFEEAKETVLKALAPMGEDYLAILKEGFENRWIDVYENEGKTSGAYSAGARVHPYVLLNHKDTLNCMFTLAHEMGHAIHSYLSNKNQPVVYSDYVIFVAEVASTCNEALLMQYLLKNTEDKKQRAYLINYFLEQFRTTLYRQTMFAEFELKINEMVAAGESLTAEGLNELYGQLNKLYFGDGIVLDDEIKLEWARIPHFYYDYYVYQYATGYSAAIALSQRILKYGEPAVKDYIGFLKGGCSTDPISLLKGAGVDMATTQPINEALAMFGELVKEMEEAMAE